VANFPYDFEPDKNKTESKKVGIDGSVGMNSFTSHFLLILTNIFFLSAPLCKHTIAMG